MRFEQYECAAVLLSLLRGSMLTKTRRDFLPMATSSSMFPEAGVLANGVCAERDLVERFPRMFSFIGACGTLY